MCLKNMLPVIGEEFPVRGELLWEAYRTSFVVNNGAGEVIAGALSILRGDKDRHIVVDSSFH